LSLDLPQVAIVVGGSAGIGRSVVDALLMRGYRVGVIARGQERLNELGEMPNVFTATADAGSASNLDSAVDELVEQLGIPTAWVNCAMATSFSRFMDISAEEFDRIVRTTFLGQVNGTRAALRHMESGSIVNVGSGLSYRAVPLQSAYCAAKHAINGFTSSVRSELIRDGSKVSLSLVQLPAVNTPQFDWARSRLDMQPQPAPPIYAPQVAAKAILQAIDTGTRELFVGSSVLKLAFGQFFAPDYLDKRLADDGVSSQKSNRPEPGLREGNLAAPVNYPSKAEGSYSERQRDSGIIVDADMARKAVFFGLPIVALATGYLLGRRR
jgi:NAD(P)-dependent dehydrogenase (short-subunit alcohol dehydrogenase family)